MVLTKAIVWIPLQRAGVQHNGTSLVLVCLADLDVLLLNMMVKLLSTVAGRVWRPLSKFSQDLQDFTAEEQHIPV